MRRNRFMQALTRFFQTIAAWILVGRKEFSKMVREATAEEDREKIEDAKKEIKKEDVEKELTPKEKETLANLIARQDMSMEQAVLRICENRFTEAGIEGFDQKTKNLILSGGIPVKEALEKSKELMKEVTKENKKVVPVYDSIDRDGLTAILGEENMDRANNLIAREIEEIEVATGQISEKDRFSITTKILKEELTNKLYDEGFGKTTVNKTFDNAVKDALEREKSPEWAMLEGYRAAKNDLSHIRDLLMKEKDFDGLKISADELRKTFTDEFKGPDSFGEEGFNHIIAEYMDGKKMPEAMAGEMQRICNTLGIPADEKIFRDRIINDMGENKLSLEKCVKEAIYDMGKEDTLIPFDPKNDQDIKDLLNKDAEEFDNPEFEAKKDDLFQNIMKGVRETEKSEIETQETVTTMTLDDMGLDLQETKALVTSIQEYDQSLFNNYPSINAVEGEPQTTKQLNAFRACLGKKMYIDIGDVKQKNFAALNERGSTAETRIADKALHKDIKDLVQIMKEHDIKSISELNQIIENTEKLEKTKEQQIEEEHKQEEEEGEITHEDIIAANAVNDLAFAMMASNAPSMDADTGFRDLDDVLDDINAPSSALDGIELDDMDIPEEEMEL